MAINVDYLRSEIAVLQEDVKLSDIPCEAKFSVPVLMTQDADYDVYTSDNTSVHLSNTIDLYIPVSVALDYGSTVIPSGAKFIVIFVTGNVNLMRIIGCHEPSDKRDSMTKLLEEIK